MMWWLPSHQGSSWQPAVTLLTWTFGCNSHEADGLFLVGWFKVMMLARLGESDFLEISWDSTSPFSIIYIYIYYIHIHGFLEDGFLKNASLALAVSWSCSDFDDFRTISFGKSVSFAVVKRVFLFDVSISIHLMNQKRDGWILQNWISWFYVIYLFLLRTRLYSSTQWSIAHGFL